MVAKAFIVLIVLSIFTISTTAQSCALGTLLTTVCASGICLINSANLLLLGCGSSATTLNISLPTTATINFSGTLTFTGINIDSSAAVTVNLNDAVTIANNLIATGTAVVKVAKGAVVTVNGKLQVAATATLNVVGNLTVEGVATVYGALHLGGDYLYNVTTQNAWIKASSGVQLSGSVSTAATITGNGGIIGSVSISGNATINVGNSPGFVYVNGDLSMSTTTTLKIEVESSSSFDTLLISGKFTRNGFLYATFLGDLPNSGTIFPFATHGSSSGSFISSHGDLGTSFNKVSANEGTLVTSFTYGSASTIALPVVMIALCILAVVF